MIVIEKKYMDYLKDNPFFIYKKILKTYIILGDICEKNYNYNNISFYANSWKSICF